MNGAPSPHELHRQANGDTAEYLRLMEAHGHLVPRRSDRCAACGISKQQILGKHEDLRLKYEALATLVRQAAPFVNAVAVMADDKGPALSWIANAAIVLDLPVDASDDQREPEQQA